MNKVAIIRIGLLLALAANSMAQTSEAVPFSLQIQTTKSSVETGQPVLVRVTTKNISGTTIRISQTTPGIEYDFDVCGANGKAATEKPLLQQLKHTQYVLRNVSMALKPEQSVSETFALSEFFELAQPGPYSVQVLRPIPYSLGHGVVKSNRITIIITPLNECNRDFSLTEAWVHFRVADEYLRNLLGTRVRLWRSDSLP